MNTLYKRVTKLSKAQAKRGLTSLKNLSDANEANELSAYDRFAQDIDNQSKKLLEYSEENAQEIAKLKEYIREWNRLIGLALSDLSGIDPDSVPAGSKNYVRFKLLEQARDKRQANLMELRTRVEVTNKLNLEVERLKATKISLAMEIQRKQIEDKMPVFNSPDGKDSIEAFKQASDAMIRASKLVGYSTEALIEIKNEIKG